MFSKSQLLLITGSIFFFSSCQQEINPNILNEAPCRIEMGYYYGGSGGINDSVAFTYTDNRLTRAEGRDDIVTYQYAGDNISVRKFYEKPGNVFWSIDSIFYDLTNHVTRIVNWSYPSSYGFDSTYEALYFTYSGNRLASVKEFFTYIDYQGNYTDSIIYTINTSAAGNLEKITLGDTYGAYDSVLYQFDTNPNYLKAYHPHFYLFDPFYELQVGLVAQLPYFYSTNNVTNFNVYGSFDNPIVYGLDSTQKLTSVKMSGFDYMKYRYSCH